MASKHNTEPARDWQCGKSVLQCNKYMFENNISCDVTFKFENSLNSRKTLKGQLLSAHKYVLISRSAVFNAMLMGPAREQSGLVTIEDIDMESFKEMLRLVCQVGGCWCLLSVKWDWPKNEVLSGIGKLSVKWDTKWKSARSCWHTWSPRTKVYLAVVLSCWHSILN